MWDPKDETTNELELFVSKTPIDRMEKVYQEAAEDELKKRKQKGK